MLNHWSSSSRLLNSRFAVASHYRYHTTTTRQHNWPSSLHRMAKFTSYCSSLTERRRRDGLVDRGRRWYKAVAHHLLQMLKRWHRAVRVIAMHRLLETWFLRHVLKKWQQRIHDLNNANITLSRALTLWSRAREHAAFQTWVRRTNRRAALQVLLTAVCQAILRIALQHWRHRNIVIRWRLFTHRRYFNAWYNWCFYRTAQRRVLRKCLQSLCVRTTRDAFLIWHGQHLLLQDEYDRKKAWYGTSIHRLMNRRQMRRSWKAWVIRSDYLRDAYDKIHAMVDVFEKQLLSMGWSQWQRYMFKWQRKRRNACGCAQALAKSKRGLGWCYKCSSLTHLQNRIEDSVELVEGMAYRLAKTALSTQNKNVHNVKTKSTQKLRRQPKNKQHHHGEAALDRLLVLLQVDREQSLNSVKLRDLEENIVEEEIHVLNTIMTGEEPTQNVHVDLESSIGLQPLSYLKDDGTVERTFVSRSARDSHERFTAKYTEIRGKKQQTYAEEQPWVDGLAGSSNRW